MWRLRHDVDELNEKVLTPGNGEAGAGSKVEQEGGVYFDLTGDDVDMGDVGMQVSAGINCAQPNVHPPGEGKSTQTDPGTLGFAALTVPTEMV